MKKFKFLTEATYPDTVVDPDTESSSPDQEIFKVLYEFVVDLLNGKLSQFENYKRKLTKSQLLELVKTGEISDYKRSYGDSDPVFNKLSKITDVKFKEINKFGNDIELILSAAEDVVPLLDSDDEEVRNQALILLNKVKQNYDTLENLLIGKQVELSKKMPPSFNLKNAKEMLRVDLVGKRTGTRKVQISQVMNRPGLILSALNQLVKDGSYSTLDVLPAVNYLKRQIKEKAIKK